MEKYGEIPKRFTKKWWEYFWDYYKIHTIAAVVAVVAIGSTISQCANKIDYDLSLVTAGLPLLSQEKDVALCTKMAEFADDVDGKDGTNVFITQIPIGVEGLDPEYEATLMQSFLIELGFGEGYIYLFSKECADSYLNRDDVADSFMPVTDWGVSGLDMEDKDRFMLYMGEPFALSMEGNALLEEAGIDTSDCYMMIRYPRYNEKDDELALKRFENTKKAAQAVLR